MQHLAGLLQEAAWTYRAAGPAHEAAAARAEARLLRLLSGPVVAVHAVMLEERQVRLVELRGGVFAVFKQRVPYGLPDRSDFPDADAMDQHIEGADDRAAAAYEFIEPQGWEFYGKPSERAMEGMRATAAKFGVPLIVEPEFNAGFLRLAPA